MKKFMMFTAMALALTLGAGATAYAWHGQKGDRTHPQYHGGGEHFQKSAQPGQDKDGAFNRHGGGHERAQNNAAVHEAEKSNPNHKDD